MDRKLVLGTFCYALFSVVLGLAVQLAVEQVTASSALGGQAAAFLVAAPLALLAARRVGRLTPLSLLFASIVLALGCLWAIIFILNSIAEPAGGHVGWSNLLNAMNWRGTVASTVAALIVPQVWLAALNRLAANNSSKPTPLRGAA